MVALVVLWQLYTWFIAHSFSGTLVTVIVIPSLLRGVQRMFKDCAEQKVGTEKV